MITLGPPPKFHGTQDNLNTSVLVVSRTSTMDQTVMMNGVLEGISPIRTEIVSKE